jgi:hypothetical protein
MFTYIILREFYVLFRIPTVACLRNINLLFKKNMYPYSINNVHVIVLVLPHSTVIVRVLCYLLIIKLLKILMLAHGGHKDKFIRMYSILFYIRIHS